MTAFDIQWNIDEDEAEDVCLPTEIEIPEYMIGEDDDASVYMDDISDYLSDVTGFCHKGFRIRKDN